MILEKIWITKNYNNIGYQGTAKFTGELGEVEINLTPEAANKVLEICGQGIIDCANEVATAMVAPLIEVEKRKQLQGEV